MTRYLIDISIILSVSILVYWVIIPGGWRKYFLFVLSLFFITVVSVPWAVYFLINVALVYSAGSLITKNAKNKKFLVASVLIWLAGSLCYFKYADTIAACFSGLGIKSPIFLQTHFSKILLPLGISYIIFRLIHYIIELYRNNTPKGSFVDFALYVLFFPTYLAGPVDRFQRFYPQAQEEQKFNFTEFNYGLFRLARGLIKKFILADSFINVIMPVLHSPGEYTRVVVICAVYGLAIQIYLDFSGYTDMAIGVARLFGYKIMENFNRPFFQPNIALFWRNWHISVYSWIRDYFFFPLFGYRASNIKLYAGIFVSMVVFMLWHKATFGFLILGIYNGLGLIVWQLFQDIKSKYPQIHKLTARPYLNPVSAFFTFSFVSLGFIFFSFDNSNIKIILSRLFIS